MAKEQLVYQVEGVAHDGDKNHHVEEHLIPTQFKVSLSLEMLHNQSLAQDDAQQDEQIEVVVVEVLKRGKESIMKRCQSML